MTLTDENDKVKCQIKTDASESLVTSLVECNLNEVDESEDVQAIPLHFKRLAKRYSHYYTTVEQTDDHFRTSTCGDLSIDYEYDVLPDRVQPIILALAYSTFIIPPPLEALIGTDKVQRYKEGWVITDTSKLNLPYVDYIFIQSKEDLYTNLANLDDVSGWLITFVCDARETSTGESSRVFLQAMMSNVKEHIGLQPEPHSINHKKEFKDEGLERNSKFWVTYSEAEISILFPDKPSRVDYVKDVSHLARKHNKSEVYDNKTKFLDIQGTTMLVNLWLCMYNPNIGVGCTCNDVLTLDMQDTRCYNGNSVKQLGGTLGIGKVQGFNFDQHYASYFYENHPLEFAYYNAIDTNISIGITHVKRSFIKGIEDAVDNELLDPYYFDNGADGKGSRTMEWGDVADLRTTIPAMAEVLVFGFMRKQGLFKHDDEKPENNSKISQDKAKGLFIDNKKQIKNEMGLTYQKVKGGLNQRTTGNMNPEFYEYVKQYDAKSMYPSVWSSGLKVPMWMPESFGSCTTTPHQLINNSLCDSAWYALKISCEFPEGSKKLNRLILQHQDDKCFVARKLDRVILRPPEIELICSEFPDLQIKVHDGWYWEETQTLEPKYLELKELTDFIFNQRKVYPKGSLENLAIKLIGNGGTFGKYAQSKEQKDPDALEQALIFNLDIDSVGVNTSGEGLLSHPVVANAVTSCARALNALVAKEHNAVACVTDSVLLTGKNARVNLDKCKTGFRFLDMLVNGARYEDETDDGTYMAIVCGARGKTLIHHDKELASLLSCLDSREKIDRAKVIIDRQAQKMSNGELPIPKFAKDGIKYDGGDWEQWRDCTFDSIERLGGYALQKTIKRLVKSSEVMRDKTKHKRVNEAVVVPRMLDCVDAGSYDFEDYTEYLQIQRTKQKLKKTDKTFGETYVWEYEKWLESYNRSRPRSLPSRKIPSYWKRVFVFLADLGIMSMTEASKVLDVNKRNLSNWKQKLINSGTYQHWFMELFSELQEDESIEYISQNCKIDTTGALQQSSLKSLLDDTILKKADKIINSLLTQIEKQFEVKVTKPSKRSKKVKLTQVA